MFTNSFQFSFSQVLFFVLIYLFFSFCNYKLYEKANVSGYLAFVPIVNTMYKLKISGRPTSSIVFLFIPYVNVLYSYYLNYKFIKAYGASDGTFVGYLFFAPLVLLHMGNNPKYQYNQEI